MTARLVRLDTFIRIRVSGKDRARFLHNFCTNNVRELPVGKACEAFFTDVKARVLAHGWVLAAPDHHEVWMLPGDESAILKHLNKYVITEDVLFESLTESTSTVAVFGSELEASLSQAGLAACWPDEDSACRFPSEAPRPAVATASMRLTWNDSDLLLISATQNEAAVLCDQLNAANVVAGTATEFDFLRIMERFPICGKDITGDHLAPEADRNAAAISYVKGCYLGQEPIARLDAMGHINRGLRVLKIQTADADLAGCAVQSSQGTFLGHITSAAIAADGKTSAALAVLRVHGVDPAAPVSVIREQQNFPATILPPAAH